MKLPKFEKEYIAQAVDSNKVIRYQAANKDRKVLEEWFKQHALKGTFAGMTPVMATRYLVNGKPFRIEQKHILWALLLALASYNVWMIAHG